VDSVLPAVIVGGAAVSAGLYLASRSKRPTVGKGPQATATIAPGLTGIPFRASPNTSPRKVAVDTIVLHYTAGGPVSGSIAWLCSVESGASAHYVVDRDGSVTQLVALDRAAWHAGAASLGGRSDVNGRSVGVEIANRGLVMPGKSPGQWTDAGGNVYTGAAIRKTHKIAGSGEVDGYWEPYPEAQVAAVVELVESLRDQFSIAHVVGHDDIALPRGRKTDPGPLWPWERVR